jgi:Mlc titration factor MtfA (ptsG expression regulator)
MPQDSLIENYIKTLDTAGNTITWLDSTHIEIAYPPTVENEEQFTLAMGLFILFFVVMFVIVAIRSRKSLLYNPNISTRPDLGAYSNGDQHEFYVYEGRKLRLSETVIENILNKHFYYFQQLQPDKKKIFSKRCKKFIERKIFTIHSSEVLKEMPVLVAATAIQLSFGLKKYLYPHFLHIHIYPQEFLRVHPVICFLEGNVSEHSIRLSWKHLYDGIKNFSNGQNVGLHEMAHALYYQTFVTEKHVDKDFRDFFFDFNDDGNKVYEIEQAMDAGLYSRYAMQDFQEFWAESVEIFFEKPLDLFKKYPNLYYAMRNILNQDTVLA